MVNPVLTAFANIKNLLQYFKLCVINTSIYSDLPSILGTTIFETSGHFWPTRYKELKLETTIVSGCGILSIENKLNEHMAKKGHSRPVSITRCEDQCMSFNGCFLLFDSSAKAINTQPKNGQL